MAKGYIIKNIKSGYFFTRSNHFEKLNYNTKIYKSYRDAYKDLERAKSNQLWDLLEQMYGVDRFYIDTDMNTIRNVESHIELRIRGLYMAEGDING